MTPTYYPFTPASAHLCSGRAFACVTVRGILWTGSFPFSTRPTLLLVEIMEWLRLNTPEDVMVLHEPEGGEFHTSQTPNKYHRFYISDTTFARAFESAVEHMPREGDLFPTLGDRDSNKLAGFLRFYLPKDFSDDAIKMWQWCRTNMTGIVYDENSLTVFEEPDDLILFQMTHVDKKELT